MLFPGWSAYPSLYLSTGPVHWGLRRAARLDNTLSVQDHDRLEAVGEAACWIGEFEEGRLKGGIRSYYILQYFAGEHEACLRLERFKPILLSFPPIR